MTILQIPAGDTWTDLSVRLETLGQSVGRGALELAIALGVMVVGWALAAVVSRLVGGVLRALRFDQGVRRVLGERATARHAPAQVAAWLTYWLVIAAAAMFALEGLGFPLATAVEERLAEVLPRIVTSAVLFALGALLAWVLGTLTRRFLESADVRAARPMGQVVTAVLTGFAVLVALEQLGFAAQFVMAVGLVALGAAGLAAGLAFGLGCRDLARDFIVEYLRSLEDDGPQRPA